MNLEENIIKIDTQPENVDYIGEDGLLYCGICRSPKEAYFSEGKILLGRDRHPVECKCQKKARKKRESEAHQKEHLSVVMRLKENGFTDRNMKHWTFDHDNGKNPQMKFAHLYVEHWEEMKATSRGYLLWGNVGTGKTYLAGCIANALMEQEISVRMTNFATVLNDLTGTLNGRNAYIERLCCFQLLILDDFGMERGTEYGLEQVYNVIDSRYRSGRPLIVTTNLTLSELQNPPDRAHQRIYDRVLAMCTPVCCSGINFRKEQAKRNMEYLKEILK